MQQNDHLITIEVTRLDKQTGREKKSQFSALAGDYEKAITAIHELLGDEAMQDAVIVVLHND